MTKFSFDDIHSTKKQAYLQDQMIAVTRQLHDISNGNPILNRCPVCQCTDISRFVEAFGFPMCRCAGCHLIFCNPYPSDEQLRAYYNSEMKSFENEFFLATLDKRIELFRPRVELIAKLFPGGEVLDVGSAIGVFVAATERLGSPFHITCCDISEEACNILKREYASIDVINADINELEKNSAFDCITMWDTLEHIVNLDELFSNVARLLKDGGAFVFSTPNTNSFEWITAGNRHVQILPPGHVNLLNIECITILCERYGFAVEDSMTLNPSLDISYVRKAVEQGKIPSERVGEFLLKALSDADFVDGLEAYLKAHKMAGNILCVARKTGSA